MDKINVVIPAKNRFDSTKDAVQSVNNQKNIENNIEIFIVDDASDEPLYSKLNNKNVSVIRNNISKGPGYARNVGLKRVKGNYLAFLDNDDKWQEDFLAKSITVLKKNNSPATMTLVKPYFYGDYPVKEKFKLILINLARNLLLIGAYIFNSKRLPRSGFYLCQISHMLFDRKQVKGIKFNETAVASEDWEYIVDATRKKELSIILRFPVKFRYEMKSNTNTQEVRMRKWNSYKSLLKKIPGSHKTGIFYKLFLLYIRMYS